MKRFKRNLEDQHVVIDWKQTESDWHNFCVLCVWPNRRIMELQGEEEDSMPHNGDVVLVRFEEIKKLRVR